MTTTALPRQSASSAGGRERLPAPPRDRRPALAALALLLVLGGALASALIAYRSGDRVDVLVAREDIAVGQVMTAADFGVARVAADPTSVIPAEALGSYTGTAALSRIPAGTLLNNSMFLAATSLAPPRSVTIGVVLTAAQRPARELEAGDVVRLFLVPRDAATGGTNGTVLASAVKVVDAPVFSGGDQVRLSLLVPESNASAVVGAASTGTLAVTRLAPGTAPSIDFVEQ